jgi:hypothetical protein
LFLQIHEDHSIKESDVISRANQSDVEILHDGMVIAFIGFGQQMKNDEDEYLLDTFRDL